MVEKSPAAKGKRARPFSSQRRDAFHVARALKSLTRHRTLTGDRLKAGLSAPSQYSPVTAEYVYIYMYIYTVQKRDQFEGVARIGGTRI